LGIFNRGLLEVKQNQGYLIHQYMKKIVILLSVFLVVFSSCTNQKELAYLSNLPELSGEETFLLSIPDYQIQSHDVLHITAMAMRPDGMINDFLSQGRIYGSATYMQGEAGQFLFGYDVDREGRVILPAIGEIHVAGLSIEDAREKIQLEVSKIFTNATVECKLLSFKFTVIGEVRTPGAFINYNNHLTVLEAIGRAGGINDFGRRDKLIVVRKSNSGTTTFSLNLQDKKILSSEAYFIRPNDVVIVEAGEKKIFNLNLPTYTFVLTAITSTITTTLLLINYLK
jgi:polysaccharide biosynthesis/export protein